MVIRDSRERDNKNNKIVEYGFNGALLGGAVFLSVVFLKAGMIGWELSGNCGFLLKAFSASLAITLRIAVLLNELPMSDIAPAGVFSFVGGTIGVGMALNSMFRQNKVISRVNKDDFQGCLENSTQMI